VRDAVALAAAGIGAGVVPVRTAPSGARFVQLDLDAHQLAILS
jgi:hypothetical protein